MSSSSQSPASGGMSVSDERSGVPARLARAESIGRYRLCFELASGGMATIYLAHAGGPGRFQKYVALKRIHAHLASRRDFVEMFHDEAAIAAGISHPNVAAVFDFGEAEGMHYIAMEYLLGEPLSRVLRACRREGTVDWRRHSLIVARIVADMCEGLHAAHELRDERGELLDVVHRDVSPDNVFVTYDGVVKLVDFGVASARNRITHTTTGVLKGKHAYMAPELLSDGGFDRRADLFSVGVVLWEALTLRRLFRRESEARTLFAVVGDPIEAPSDVAPDVDAALDAIAMRALARDPAERYATAREIAHDLRAYLLDQRTDVTAADVEAWIGSLCPDGLAARRALLASVDRIVAEEVVIPVELAEETTIEPAGPRRRNRRRAFMGAGVVLAAGIIGAIGWAAREPAPSSAERVPPALSEREPSAAAPPPSTPTTLTTTPSTTTPSTTTPSTPSATPIATSSGAGAGAGSERAPAAAEEPAPRRARRGRARGGDPGELRIGLRAREGGLLPDDAWAAVRVDGREVDGTPPFTLPLAPGRHVIEVRPYGRGPAARRIVDIAPGERRPLIIPIDAR